MAEQTEKQEGQKTVVAFIAGLLIGGLLVWVFSSSPEGGPASVTTGTDTDDAQEQSELDTEEDTTNTSRISETTTTRETSQPTTQPQDTADQPTTGDGAIEVSNQGAGSLVVLSDVEYPENAGWIVVRDYEDNTPGRILGAARFNVTDGLTPTSVNLLRATEPDTQYQVTFYSENGDRVFDTASDRPLEGFGEVFTAQ